MSPRPGYPIRPTSVHWILATGKQEQFTKDYLADMSYRDMMAKYGVTSIKYIARTILGLPPRQPPSQWSAQRRKSHAELTRERIAAGKQVKEWGSGPKPKRWRCDRCLAVYPAGNDPTCGRHAHRAQSA